VREEEQWTLSNTTGQKNLFLYAYMLMLISRRAGGPRKEGRGAGSRECTAGYVH